MKKVKSESMDPRDFTDKAGYLVTITRKGGKEEIKQFFHTKPAAQKYADRIKKTNKVGHVPTIYKTVGRKMMKEDLQELTQKDLEAIMNRKKANLVRTGRAKPEPKQKDTSRGRGTDTEPGAPHLMTVVASVPGIAEQSLKATLESLPALRVVGTASGCLTALQMVRDWQADLVVLDWNLPADEVRQLLWQLESEGLNTFSLVLAATSAQVRQALVAGASAALRRDSSIGQLRAVIDRFQRSGSAQIEE